MLDTRCEYQQPARKQYDRRVFFTRICRPTTHGGARAWNRADGARSQFLGLRGFARGRAGGAPRAIFGGVPRPGTHGSAVLRGALLMSLATSPHTHGCPHCARTVDCRCAREGGCLSPRSDMTCDPCAAVRDGLDPRDAEQTCGHTCACAEQLTPDERCARCGRWQVNYALPEGEPALGLMRADEC